MRRRKRRSKRKKRKRRNKRNRRKRREMKEKKRIKHRNMEEQAAKPLAYYKAACFSVLVCLSVIV